MSTIVHLKWGEQPESDRRYLLVRRLGRVRGEDFFVDPCAGMDAPERAADEPRAFASLASALKKAESFAQTCGVETIYVRMNG
jgi:hypothetical protein